MLRKALVQERVVRAQQVERAPVLAHHTVDQQLRFLPERLPEVVVEIREDPHVGRDRIQVAQVEPLLGEVGNQVPRPRVGQHAPHLALEHRRFAEIAPRGGIQQLLVGNAAPEEEGETRRQFEIADAIRSACRPAGRLPFDAEQELGARQDRGQTHLDARLESVAGSRRAVQLERCLQIDIRDGPPIRPPHQRRQDPLGATVFFFLIRGPLPPGTSLRSRGPSAPRRSARKSSGPAREHASSAGCVAGAHRVVRADDRDLVDSRLDARMPVVIEVGLVRLTSGFEQQRRFRLERHADGVRTGGHGHADLEMAVQVVLGGSIVLRHVRLRCGVHREDAHLFAIQKQIELMRFGEALDVLVAIARQANRDLVLTVDRERMRNQRATACPDRKALEVLLLRQVRSKTDGRAARRKARTSDGQPADLLGRRHITLEQGGGTDCPPSRCQNRSWTSRTATPTPHRTPAPAGRGWRSDIQCG